MVILESNVEDVRCLLERWLHSCHFRCQSKRIWAIDAWNVQGKSLDSWQQWNSCAEKWHGTPKTSCGFTIRSTHWLWLMSLVSLTRNNLSKRRASLWHLVRKWWAEVHMTVQTSWPKEKSDNAGLCLAQHWMLDKTHQSQSKHHLRGTLYLQKSLVYHQKTHGVDFHDHAGCASRVEHLVRKRVHELDPWCAMF